MQNQLSPTNSRIAKTRSEAPDRHSVTKRPQIPLEQAGDHGLPRVGQHLLEWQPSASATPPEVHHLIRANPPLRTSVNGSARRYPPPGHARGTACASETMITGGGRISRQPNHTTRRHAQESLVESNAPVQDAAMVPRRGVQIFSLPERGNSSLADSVPSLTRPC